MFINTDNLSERFLCSETFATLVRMLRMTSEDEDYKRRVREFEVSYEKAVYGTTETHRERQERGDVPERYLSETFDTFMTRYAEDSEKLGKVKKFASLKTHDHVLMLLGPNGTGKTHLGSAIIGETGGRYVNACTLTVEYESAADFNAESRRDEIINGLVGAKMLVIDEIGRAEKSETEAYLLETVLCGRYDRKLPSVIISNMSKEALLRFLGKAVTDRLRETCVAVELEGDSYRLTKRDAEL